MQLNDFLDTAFILFGPVLNLVKLGSTGVE